MSIYNRKMFKRNARNALNSSAGVQNFFTGGTVGNYRTFTSPLTGRTFGTVGRPVGGVRSLQPFDIAKRFIKSGRNIGYGQSAGISPGEFAVLQAAQSANMAGRRVKDPTGTRIGGVLESVLNPAARVAAGGGAFARSLAGSATQGVLGSGKRGDATMGDRVSSMLPGGLDRDFLASQGIAELVDAKNMQTASSRGRGFPVTRIPEGGMAAERIMQEQLNRNTMDNSPEAIARRQAEAEARKQMEEQGIVFSDQETGKVGDKSETEFMAGLIMDDIEAAKQDQRKEDEYLKAVQAADRDEADVDLAEYRKEEDKSGDGASGGGGQEGGDAAPSAKEEIERVINSGTKEEQEKTLDGFIKEFMDKAPGYEGADSGLILAKIGFAMAAGKSENAIENITSALSSGADMLIKDKAKKDEFNRQLKLSAMQYGFTEVGKIRAEDRLAAREGRKLNYFVAEEDVTIGDRTYSKGETVPVTTEYILNSGLPSGLQTPEMAKAAITANSAYQKALAKAQKDKIIDAKTYTGLVENMNQATTDFVSANQLRELVQGNIVRNAEGKITGVGPAFQQLINRAYNAAGVDAGEKYESVDKFNQDMRRVSNLLLKDLLGEGSKNVSNIDRTLADEIVGLYAGYGGYIFQDENLLNERLQNVLTTLEGKERNALNVFRGTLDSTEGLTFASGKDVTFNVPQAAQQALYGGQAAQPTYELQDGVYRRIGVKQRDRIA